MASDVGPLRAWPRKRPPTILMLRISPAAVARRSFRAGAFRAGSARAGAGAGRTRPFAETAAARALVLVPSRSLVAGRATAAARRRHGRRGGAGGRRRSGLAAAPRPAVSVPAARRRASFRSPAARPRPCGRRRPQWRRRARAGARPRRREPPWRRRRGAALCRPGAAPHPRPATRTAGARHAEAARGPWDPARGARRPARFAAARAALAAAERPLAVARAARTVVVAAARRAAVARGRSSARVSGFVPNGAIGSRTGLAKSTPASSASVCAELLAQDLGAHLLDQPRLEIAELERARRTGGSAGSRRARDARGCVLISRFLPSRRPMVSQTLSPWTRSSRASIGP